MKKLLLPLIVLLTLCATAQNGSKANYTYLKEAAGINISEIEAAYAKFQDSLNKAIETSPKVKALQADYELRTSTNQEDLTKANLAEQQLELIKGQIDQLVYNRTQQLLQPLTKLQNTIKAVIVEKGYEICFLYNEQGIEELVYDNERSENEDNYQIKQCAKKKAREADVSDPMQYVNVCQDELLQPVLLESVDITTLVEQRLKK